MTFHSCLGKSPYAYLFLFFNTVLPLAPYQHINKYCANMFPLFVSFKTVPFWECFHYSFPRCLSLLLLGTGKRMTESKSTEHRQDIELPGEVKVTALLALALSHESCSIKHGLDEECFIYKVENFNALVSVSQHTIVLKGVKSLHWEYSVQI